jgi:hypothetical protein
MTNQTFYRKTQFNRLIPQSKFVLVGNYIDGKVNVGITEFESFEKVKNQLPDIIENLKFEGEWALELYQVPVQYKIHHQYGYYRIPKPGKRIFKYSYMEAGDINKVLISDVLIHFESTSHLYNGNTDNDKYQEFLTIQLKVKD